MPSICGIAASVKLVRMPQGALQKAISQRPAYPIGGSVRLITWRGEVIMKQVTRTLFVWDFGSVSKATRGSMYQWPFYENWAPPFNHMCPNC